VPVRTVRSRIAIAAARGARRVVVITGEG